MAVMGANGILIMPKQEAMVLMSSGNYGGREKMKTTGVVQIKPQYL